MEHLFKLLGMSAARHLRDIPQGTGSGDSFSTILGVVLIVSVAVGVIAIIAYDLSRKIRNKDYAFFKKLIAIASGSIIAMAALIYFR